MDLREFKRALYCGLGRCVTELRACKDREIYRAAVLECCLNNPCFDTQSEGTRSAYVYELVSAFDDTNYFLHPVLDKLKTMIDDGGWLFAHLCDLTAEFARRGKSEAVTALKEIYGKLYSLLLTRRDCEGYDGACDNFERLCITFCEIYGLPAFIKEASDLGELFTRNDSYGGNDFEWFYIHFSNVAGKENLKNIMRVESEKSPYVRAFYNEIQKAIAPAPKNSASKKWRKPDMDDILRRAEEAVAENDPDKKAELLIAFRLHTFPLDHRYLIGYSKSENGNLRETAFDALENCKSEEVRAYSLQLIAQNREIIHAINMLIANFSAGDGELLFNCLNGLQIDADGESGWHSVVAGILSAFDEGINLPRWALDFVYEKSRCSHCREEAVRALAKRGWLTFEMKSECLYDSNADIREYAKQFFN